MFYRDIIEQTPSDGGGGDVLDMWPKLESESDRNMEEYIWKSGNVLDMWPKLKSESDQNREEYIYEKVGKYQLWRETDYIGG